jgi:dienelactone hydrolase
MTDEDLLLHDPGLSFGSGVVGVCDICGKRQAVIVLQKERYKLCVLDFLNKTWINSKTTPGRPLPPYRSERIWFDTEATASGRAQGVVLSPTKPTRRPVVLVTSDVYGLTTLVLDAGIRLAREGFEVFLPDLNKLDGLGPRDHIGLRADVRFRGGVRVESPRVRKLVTLYDDALAHLRARPLADVQKVGIFGASYGGSLACAVAGEDRGIAALALAFPCPVQPADYLRLINAPVLFVAGDRDPLAARARAQFEAARSAGGLDVRYERFAGQQHLFLARDSPAYSLAPAEEGWRKILGFLRERLMPPPPRPPAPPTVSTIPPTAGPRPAPAPSAATPPVAAPSPG